MRENAFPPVSLARTRLAPKGLHVVVVPVTQWTHVQVSIVDLIASVEAENAFSVALMLAVPQQQLVSTGFVNQLAVSPSAAMWVRFVSTTFAYQTLVMSLSAHPNRSVTEGTASMTPVRILNVRRFSAVLL